MIRTILLLLALSAKEPFFHENRGYNWAELRGTLEMRDSLAAKLADESDQGIIPNSAEH